VGVAPGAGIFRVNVTRPLSSLASRITAVAPSDLAHLARALGFDDWSLGYGTYTPRTLRPCSVISAPAGSDGAGGGATGRG